MTDLTLMAVMAHPDDETLGLGGVIARYTAEGIPAHVLTATRGERGWFGAPEDNPGETALGKIRERELISATNVLGAASVTLLDYIDGDLDQADPKAVQAEIATQIRQVRPQVVITFDPFGAYGHPDHIAISQFTQAAIILAADPCFEDGLQPHRVDKLYYMIDTEMMDEIYQEAFGELVMHVDGERRTATAWPNWSVTTRIDTRAYRKQVWEAVNCHETQVPGYDALKHLPADKLDYLWSQCELYRAFSLVNGGRQIEDDLFAGLR